ncbi:MAG: hypothetical protein IPK82_06025 [Polyangiaceae bacterium]|nr:hypothetical protein [Polyangiaceae bacterium]
MNDAKHIADLLLSWSHSKDGFDLSTLTSDFVFDDGFQTIGRTDFIRRRVLYGGLTDAQILVCWESDECGAVVLEGTDEVTLLHHRISWVGCFREGRICRVWACSREQIRLHPQMQYELQRQSDELERLATFRGTAAEVAEFEQRIRGREESSIIKLLRARSAR